MTRIQGTQDQKTTHADFLEALASVDGDKKQMKISEPTIQRILEMAATPRWRKSTTVNRQSRIGRT